MTSQLKGNYGLGRDVVSITGPGNPFHEKPWMIRVERIYRLTAVDAHRGRMYFMERVGGPLQRLVTSADYYQLNHALDSVLS